MATIANLMVMIGGNIKGLTDSMNTAKSQMNSFSSSAKTVGGAMSLGVTLPILGVGAAILKSGMEFEAGMSSIKAVTGATAGEMKSFHDLALKMGADTKYSAVEAAQGIEELSKAGVSTANILNGGLKGALALASAGGIDLASAAEIASTALNAFKADNLTVMRAADLLAGAANASATDVGELKFALSSVGSVASGIGMSFKDTTTALAEFAQNGLKGSDAGTSLKTMLMNLVPQSKQQIAMFGKLGLLTKSGTSAFFDQTGKLKNLKDISGTLRKSMAGMTDEMRFSTMQTLFGSDAIRAANILYKEGADGVDTMYSAMSNVTAVQVAAEKQNNLKGSIENLKGSIETALVKIYEMNDGAFKKMADYLTTIVNKFTELSPKTQEWILIISGLVAAAGPVLFFIGGIGSGLSTLAGLFSPVIAGFTALAAWIGTAVEAIGLWIGGAGTFGEAMLLISGPVGWIIAGIIALVAAIIYFYTTNESFRGVVDGIFQAIGDMAMWLWNNVLVPFGSFLSSTFVTAWGAVTTAASWLLDNVLKPLGEFLMTFWNTVVIPIAAALTDVLGVAFTAVADIAKSLWENVLIPLATFFKETFGPGVEALSTVFKFLWNSVLVPFATFMSSILKPAWDVMAKVIIYLIDNALKPIVTYVGGALKTTFDTVFKGIGKLIEAAQKIFVGLMTFITGVFSGDWEKAWNGIGSIFDGIWTGIKATINTAIGLVNNLINTINKIPLVNIPNIPTIPNSSSPVTAHADGGVFTKPTMWGNHLIGEKGPEALVPLNKYGGFGGGSSGSSQPIVIYLDGTKIYEGMDSQLGSKLLGLGGAQ